MPANSIVDRVLDYRPTKTYLNVERSSPVHVDLYFVTNGCMNVSGTQVDLADYLQENTPVRPTSLAPNGYLVIAKEEGRPHPPHYFETDTPLRLNDKLCQRALTYARTGATSGEHKDIRPGTFKIHY